MIMLVGRDVTPPGIVVGASCEASRGTDTSDVICSEQSLHLAVLDVVKADQLLDHGPLNSQGSDQFLPGENAMLLVVVLSNVDDVVVTQTDLLVAVDVLTTGVRVPSPGVVAEVALCKRAIIALGSHPKLHHNIVDAAKSSSFIGIATAALDIGERNRSGIIDCWLTDLFCWCGEVGNSTCDIGSCRRVFLSVSVLHDERAESQYCQ